MMMESMKVSIKLLSKEKENMSGMMAGSIRANGVRIRLMDLGYTNGQINRSIKENGNRIR